MKQAKPERARHNVGKAAQLRLNPGVQISGL